MNEQKPAKWVDPRTPVSVTHIGKFTVTIYDQAAYDASLRQYPDSDDTHNQHTKKKTGHTSSLLAEKKPASRYNCPHSAV